MPNDTCSVDWCDKPVNCRGWCRMHYIRHLRGTPMDKPPLRRGLTGCEVPGCSGDHFSRGWCQKHYTRWKRHGDPEHVELIFDDEPRRFWAMVDVRQPDECWEWQGYRGKSGHGFFKRSKIPGNTGAYRVAYEWLVGPIPDGLTIDHLCLNPPCVNPNHLEPVTQSENTRRWCMWRWHGETVL